MQGSGLQTSVKGALVILLQGILIMTLKGTRTISLKGFEGPDLLPRADHGFYGVSIQHRRAS